MAVLLHLNDARLERLAWRLAENRPFTVTIPERLVRLQSPTLCLIISDHPVISEFGDAEVDTSQPPQRWVVALARVRSSPRPSTTDDRLKLLEPQLVQDLLFDDLLSELTDQQRHRLAVDGQAPASRLDGALESAVVQALEALRPALAGVIARLRRAEHLEPVEGPSGAVLTMERDALRLALDIAGVGPVDAEWTGSTDGGFLANLAYAPPEDSLLAHDAARFPDWTLKAGGRPDWLTFSDGRQHLRVGNVNRTPLERVLGVDLIYRHVESDTFVLVQYKRMTRSKSGHWQYRPDAKLREQLDRMRRVDAATTREPVSARTWRLHPGGAILKLVRAPARFDPTNDRLLAGIYLPLAYLELILADASSTGPRGGPVLGYNTIDRYITSDLFVELVRQGWIGTTGVTTTAVAQLIEAAVRGNRSVLIAEEAGDQAGAQRRRRPSRGTTS